MRAADEAPPRRGDAGPGGGGGRGGGGPGGGARPGGEAAVSGRAGAADVPAGPVDQPREADQQHHVADGEDVGQRPGRRDREDVAEEPQGCVGGGGAVGEPLADRQARGGQGLRPGGHHPAVGRDRQEVRDPAGADQPEARDVTVGPQPPAQQQVGADVQPHGQPLDGGHGVDGDGLDHDRGRRGPDVAQLQRPEAPDVATGQRDRGDDGEGEDDDQHGWPVRRCWCGRGWAGRSPPGRCRSGRRWRARRRPGRR